MCLVEPIKVLCIGDSITQGGKRDRQEYTYRYPLFIMLTQLKLNFRFIGSQTRGLHEDATWPIPFDPHHEGYYGQKAGFVRDRIVTTLPSLELPDIALIHLGTNDQQAPNLTEALIEPLVDIIALLRTFNPHVIILIGHLNAKSWVTFKIGLLLTNLRYRLNTKMSPIIMVHHYRGWVANPNRADTDTFDWVHPNPPGQHKMAEKWFNAMRPFLKIYE